MSESATTPELSNRPRAVERATLIMAGTPSFAEDEETQLADLLADLRHWATAKDVDFDSALDRSEVYVEADNEGGNTQPA